LKEVERVMWSKRQQKPTEDYIPHHEFMLGI
jgi:hypothetical protein